MGKSGESLFVYSDVVPSVIVGNQVTDLMRDESIISSHYISIASVCSNTINTITMEVADHKGDSPKFGDGNITAPLHFKRQA